MRNLITCAEGNLKGSKEFNHLRITNLDEFLHSYTNKFDYYRSPFAILADLEEQVKFEDILPEGAMIPYKEDGFVIFDYERTYEKDGIRFVQFSYSDYIS